MAIKLVLKGFDDLLKDIEKAGGKIDDAAEDVLKKSATIMQDSLTEEMEKANVPSDLISRMPSYEVENDHGRITARVGYRKGTYNPHHLSDGYKVVFLNYGTPRRRKHGKIVDESKGGTIKLGFISRAKKSAKPQIYKAQKKMLEDILWWLK